MTLFQDFNWKFYINYYPDLIQANINNYSNAFDHWNNYGEKEGRICNFDWMIYKKNYNLNNYSMEETTNHWINNKSNKIFFENPLYDEINYNLSIVIDKNTKLCLFAVYHNNEDNTINNNLIYAKHISQFFDYVIILSNIKYPSFSNIYYLQYKTNIGFDFGIYLRFFKVFKKHIIDYPNELLLMNDSCIIHSSFKSYFNWSKKYNNSLLGLTENIDIEHHIQSFFLHFKGDTVKECFNFMDKFNINQLVKETHPDDYYDNYMKKYYNINLNCYKFYVIVKFEIGISKYIKKKYIVIPFINYNNKSIYYHPEYFLNIIPISKKAIIYKDTNLIIKFNVKKKNII